MIQITAPEIESYLFSLAASQDEPVLCEMEAFGRARNFPMVDRLVGGLLKLLAQTAGIRRVFEMGSGFGYSAYWFAHAVGLEGHVTCTDGNEKLRRQAETFLQKAGLWDRVHFQVGDAVPLLQQAEGPFDLIFNDIDKGAYPAAWHVAREKLRPGGLYVADNTLWFGRVAERHVTDDIASGWTEAIREHNRAIFADPAFEATLIPLRDGVLIARKKNVSS